MAFVTALLAVPCEIALSAGNYENLSEVLSAEQEPHPCNRHRVEDVSIGFCWQLWRRIWSPDKS